MDLPDDDGLRSDEEEEEEEEEEAEQLRPNIIPGQGSILQQNTRNAMQQILNRHPVNMEEVDTWVQDIVRWFDAMLTSRAQYENAIWEERTSYFRALFNLTTDRVTRLRLVHFKACGLMTRMTEELISVPQDLDNTNIAVMVAAIANVVYEEPTKREMTLEHKAAELLTKLLKNPTPNVLTHAARGVFSLTTVFDFKKIFATQPGLLESLVACLRMSPEELITNAAGALANIAIHPESKLPIANNGSLPILINLARTHQSESILHQTSRCLFSLAAEKTNRAKMVDLGVLHAVSRLIYLNNVEVQANIIGCLGNLCMSETAAQEVVNVDRLLVILQKSETVVLDRQTTRILHSFAYRKELRPKFVSSVKNLATKFLQASEENVVRDLSGMFVNIVDGDVAMRRICCESSLFPRCVALFRQLGGALDTLARFTYLLSEDESAVEWTKANAEATIQLFSKLTEPPTARLVSQFAFGILANLAKEPELAKVMHEQEGLCKRALTVLFECDSRGKRHHASRFLANLGQRQAAALASLAEYGGNNGERKRYLDSLASLFRTTFSCTALSSQDFEDMPCELDGAEESRPRPRPVPVCLVGGMKQIVLQGLEENEYLVANVFAPFIDQSYPGLLARTEELQSPNVCATEEVWTFFWQYLSTRNWSQSGNAELAAPVLDGAIELAKTLELDMVVKELDKIKAGHALLAQQKREAEVFFREESNFEEESTALGEIGFALTMPQEFAQFDGCDLFFRFPAPDEDAMLLPQTLTDMLAQWRAPPVVDQEGGSILLRAHRHVLVARSEYFRALFRNPWREQFNSTFDYSNDLSLQSFLWLLRYAYFGLDASLKQAVNEDKDLAMELLQEAGKFDFSGLQYYCEYSLSKALAQNAASYSYNVDLAETLLCLSAPFLKLDLAINVASKLKEWTRERREDKQQRDTNELLRDLFTKVGFECVDLTMDACEGEEEEDEGKARKRQRLEEEPPNVDAELL